MSACPFVVTRTFVIPTDRRDELDYLNSAVEVLKDRSDPEALAYIMRRRDSILASLNTLVPYDQSLEKRP